jgi:hypothetical protein
MRVVNLTYQMPDEQAATLAGTLLGDDAYDFLAEEDCDIYKPNGEPLIKFRKKAIPLNFAKDAYVALRDAAAPTSNRGIAAGKIDEDDLAKEQRHMARAAGKVTGTRYKALKRDGTLSNTNHAKEVQSGIVGYFERNPRFPYCRTTAYSLEHPERFVAALPYIRAISDVFKRESPERYAAQRAMIEKTHPDFYIHGTVFTTVTVNKNWQTAVHKDVGDLKEGFGVMSVLQAGHYTGGNLVFPAFRVAVNLRSCDVLLADVHEWHGNTPLVGEPGKYERVSCVLYYRANMFKCSSSEEELERAKNRKPGDPIFDDH